MRKFLYAIFFFVCLNVFAQPLSQADNSYIQFKELLQQGNTSANMYIQAHQAYLGYASAIKDMESTTSEYQKYKERLLELFPVLGNGAYFYTQMNNQQMAVKFAQAYVDLSLLYAVSDQNLTSKENYIELSYFAAMNTFYQGELETAILYFQAYLSSSDTDLKRKEVAFQGLVWTYYKLKNYDNAKYIASRALEMFPNSWNIVSPAVNACVESNDVTMLPKFLDIALRIKPNELALMKIQGLMYEKQKNYAEAVNVYRKMDAIQPNNQEIVCHLAFDAYNAGVQVKSQAGTTNQKSERNRLEQQAQGYFRQAAPLLQDVLNSNPYAVNVAKALAMCYNVTNNAAALENANKNLMAMHTNTVKAGDMPVLQTNYNPTADLSSVAYTPEPEKDTFKSDVDIDIPIATLKNNNTYAIIIGNEDYQQHQKVDYAKNDAEVFAEYCTKTLGIPKDHIRLRTNATKVMMDEQIDFMSDKAKMNPGELNFIFYYSGHGLPDTSTGDSYLLPTDASGTNFKYCCKLDSIYSIFHSMDAKGVTVFLDACFSGATGNGNMLFKERYVEYTPKETTVQGNVVVFSSSSGNQTSLFYDDMHHGFFTYFLLKNLKETNGTIKFETLSKNLKKEVDNAAFDKKNKHQTPTVKASVSMGDLWKNMSLVN